jgi:AraC-like DNA-binding protein
MEPRTLPDPGLHLFEPPYRAYHPFSMDWNPAVPFLPGAAVVWIMSSTPRVYGELEWIRARPPSLPFFLVLPEPEDITPLAPILRDVPELRPKGVLPSASQDTLEALRTLLAAPPNSLPDAVADHLTHLGVVRDRATRSRIETIFATAPHTSSIEKLAGQLCQSRRTLGRFFSDRGLPVPSHWLQIARLLHVAVQLQNTRTNINRVSTRFGYPDGFTMSNSMKRLTGYRPTFVREHLGWEWVIEAWLRGEGGMS